MARGWGCQGIRASFIRHLVLTHRLGLGWGPCCGMGRWCTQLLHAKLSDEHKECLYLSGEGVEVRQHTVHQGLSLPLGGFADCFCCGCLLLLLLPAAARGDPGCDPRHWRHPAAVPPGGARTGCGRNADSKQVGEGRRGCFGFTRGWQGCCLALGVGCAHSDVWGLGHSRHSSHFAVVCAARHYC